jgi:hypothetical protein
MRLEIKFIEKVIAFIGMVKKIFAPKLPDHYQQSLSDIILDLDKCNFFNEQASISDDTLLILKQIVVPDIKICFSLKFDDINIFLSNSSFFFIKPLIEELGLKILNVDSVMFNFVMFMKKDIYKSTNKFLYLLSTFYLNQFISELVKSLGGISSITSMQIVENLNKNIIGNMRMERNQVKLVRNNKKKNKFVELYESSYENLYIVVGGMFMFAFKISALIGKVLVYLTFDQMYQHRRTNKMNKTIKSLGSGIVISFKLLLFSFLAAFTQFYHVPVSLSARMNNKKKTLVVLLSIMIVNFFNLDYYWLHT